mgnify:CR=1 FL=1|jgi:hypothetical protein
MSDITKYNEDWEVMYNQEEVELYNQLDQIKKNLMLWKLRN